MKGKITDEVSIEEMRTLREEGLSNREIGRRLDVSYETVRKYLGNQPKGIRAVYGSLRRPVEEAPVTPVTPQHTLQMEIQTTCYKGECARYTVDSMGMVEIRMMGSEDPKPITINKDRLQTYILELMDLYNML